MTRETLRALTGLVIAAGVAASGVAHAGGPAAGRPAPVAEQCRPPSYRTTTIAGGIHLVFDRRDLTIQNVMCTVRRMKEKDPERTEWDVLVFDQVWAADLFAPNFAEPDTESRANEHVRAMYFFTAAERREYLAIFPFGFNLFGTSRFSKYETTMDLPSETRQHCRLELDDRCLLALTPVALESPGDEVAGTVTMTAAVSRTGQITNVQSIANTVLPASARGLTASKAMRNLRTWWLEPASRESRIRVLYRVGLSSPSLDSDDSGVSIELSDGTSVHAKRIP